MTWGLLASDWKDYCDRKGFKATPVQGIAVMNLLVRPDFNRRHRQYPSIEAPSSEGQETRLVAKITRMVTLKLIGMGVVPVQGKAMRGRWSRYLLRSNTFHENWWVMCGLNRA